MYLDCRSMPDDIPPRQNFLTDYKYKLSSRVPVGPFQFFEILVLVGL